MSTALSPLSGEFADAALERKFQLATFAENHRHARVLLLILLGTGILFFANDFRHWGTDLFRPVVTVRSGMIAITFGALLWLRSIRTPVGLDRLIWTTQVVLFLCAAQVFHLVPSPLALAVAILLILINYLVFPVAFWRLALGGVFFSILFLFALFAGPNPLPPYFLGIMIVLVMVNLVGIAIQRRDNGLRRLQFAGLEAELERSRQLQESEARFRSQTQLEDAARRVLALAFEDLPIQALLERTLAIVTGLPGLQANRRGALFLADPEMRQLRMIAHHGVGAAAEYCATVPFGHCICGRTADLQEILECSHVDERHDACLPGMEDHGHICIPLHGSQGVRGVLSLSPPAGCTLATMEKDFLMTVARTLATILERRDMEAKLRREKDFSESVINALPGIFYLFDASGRPALWNHQLETVTGYGPEEIRLLKPLDLIAEVDRPRIAGEIEKAFETGQCRAEGLLQPKQGDPIAFDFTGMRYDSSDGPCLLGMGVEVSERHAMEEALKRSNADLEDFAYAISHDLQEPLRMISSYLSLLRRRYEGKIDKEADDFIAFAVDGSHRMHQMIHDLLEYSRVSSRGAEPRPVDSGEALQGACDNLVRAIADNGATVDAGPLPVIMADASQLMRLFQNLVGNAIKYRDSGRNPKVSVTACRTDGEWRFAVADNGIGIDSKYYDRIFRVFQRLHSRAEFPGTGIGLAVCKRIVERHGGRIWLESTPGEGSTFYFTLPAPGEDEE